MELKELKHIERSRIYHYNDGSKLTINGVTHFYNSNTTHRLKTSEGKLWIVEKKFVAVEIDSDEFTL